MIGTRVARIRREEQGFTLPEVLAVIVILGILVAIAVVIWLGILERRRVEAATNQLVSDMRLAHSSATNELTDWRVVLSPEKEDEDQGLDYSLVRLKAPYPGPDPKVESKVPRTFPGNVKVVNISGALDKKTDSGWIVPPSEAGTTRTLEFDVDGAMNFYQAASGGTCVTVDTNPANKITVTAATSRVTVKPIEPEACAMN